MNNICQSCGMVMDEHEYGTNLDKSSNKDFCKYCYINGKFGKDETMEEMIESCIPFRINEADCPNAETARKQMLQIFPTLKRWRKQA